MQALQRETPGKEKEKGTGVGFGSLQTGMPVWLLHQKGQRQEAWLGKDSGGSSALRTFGPGQC